MEGSVISKQISSKPSNEVNYNLITTHQLQQSINLSGRDNMSLASLVTIESLLLR